MLLEYTEINTYTINLKEGKQPLYRPIYCLGLIELETLKTDSNDALGDDKAFLPFVQELPLTNTDFYFLSKLAAVVNNHGDKKVAPLTLGSKFIYYVNYVFDMHRLCLPTSVILEIIAITYGKGHPSFMQYYEIVSHS